MSSPADPKADHERGHPAGLCLTRQPVPVFDRSPGTGLASASAAYQALFEEFGITAQRVALAARTSLARLSTTTGPMRASSGSKDKEHKHEFPA